MKNSGNDQLNYKIQKQKCFSVLLKSSPGARLCRVGVMPTPLHTPTLKEHISSQHVCINTWRLGKPAQSLLLPLNRCIIEKQLKLVKFKSEEKNGWQNLY